MPTITVYNSAKDGGAGWPVPSVDTETTTNKARYMALYEVLKMCLVTGYTGKAAAGWTMLHDEIAAGTGLRYAITNAAQSGVLVVESSGTYYLPIIRLCDSALDLDTLVNDWSFMNSAANGTPTAKKHYFGLQYNNAYWKASSPYVSHFFVVATENSAYIQFTRATYVDGSLIGASSSHYSAIYIGAAWGADVMTGPSGPELGNFVALGGLSGAYNLDNSSASSYFFRTNHSLYAPASFLRDHDGLPQVARDWDNLTSAGALTSVLNYRYGTVQDAACLMPGLIVRRLNINYVHVQQILWRIPIFINILQGSGDMMTEYLKTYGNSDIFEPWAFEGKNYIVPAAPGSGADFTTPVISLDSEDWP